MLGAMLILCSTFNDSLIQYNKIILFKQINYKQTFQQMIISYHEPYINTATSLQARHFKVILTTLYLTSQFLYAIKINNQ